jgi:hypothetical protein
MQAARLSVFVLTLAERELLLQSKGTLFLLRSAWSLHLASLAHGRVAESQSGGGLKTPYSAALGFATALGFLLDVGVLSLSGETPEPPSPLRSAWLLRSVWLSSTCVQIVLP